MSLKPLMECTLSDVVKAWNTGFEGYFTDVNMNADQFIKRMASEDLSATHSFLLFEGTEPIGIVINGIRQIKDTKVAWNGGTGVAKAHRGRGVGKQLIEKSLDVYKEQGVNLATLESIAENHAAISLYESMGYEISEHLRISNKEGSTQFEDGPHLHSDRGPASNVAGLSFYQRSYPWQNHWQSLKDGQSIIVKDKENPVGYALFKQTPDQSTTILYQCEVNPDSLEPIVVGSALLSRIFSSGRNVVFDMPKTNGVTELLEKNGFQMQFEQVLMAKTL